MLMLGVVARMHCYGRAIHMQLTHNGCAALESWLPGRLRPCTFAQAQKAHQDVLLWILICQEGLPAPIGHVVAPDQLHIFGLHLKVAASCVYEWLQPEYRGSRD